MLSLRLSSGLSFSALEERYQVALTERFTLLCEKLVSEGLAEKTENGIRLTDEGFLMQNPIIIKLLDALNI